MSNRKKQKTNIFGSLLVGFLVVLFAYLYFLNTKAKASWFDDAWRYRVAVPISAHTTAETNVYITLSGADGINTTDTTKFQTDCGDIRFVNEAGDLLSYYLTTACGLAQTGFQVYFDSFPAGAQTIYYYYGNPSASNGFSGASMGAAATGVTLGTRGSETEAPSSPTVYFRLDEGTGQTVANSMETVNNGTLGPDATVTGTDPTWRSEELCMVGKCLEFESASSQYVNVANTIASVNSVSFWVKPTSTTTSLMVLNGAAGNASISVSSGTISAGAGFTSPTIYVNGAVKSTLVANEWQFVTVTTATGISASNIMIGRVNTGYLDGFIDEVKLFGSVIPASQIKAGYASGLAKSSSIKNSSVSFGGGSAAGTLANGLVGYWKMDESSWTVNCSTKSVLDSSGNANNGAACPNSTGPAGGGIGKFGRGGAFDGTDDYVSVTDADTLSFANNTMSAGAWVKRSGNPAANEYIFLKGVGTWEYGLYIDTSGAFGVTLWDSGGNTVVNEVGSAGAIVTDGNWHHIAFTADGSVLRLYINGVADDVDPVFTGSMSNTASTFYIGDRSDVVNSELQGSLDEIRLYNRVLNATEISSLYKYTLGPVAYWNFNENSGQSLTYGMTGSSTLGLDASVTTTDPVWATGKYGGALQFDGVNDVVRTDDDNAFSFGNSTVDSAYTITAWVYMDSGSGTSRYFADKSSEWALRVGSDGRLICAQEDNSTGGYIGRNWTGPVQTGAWYHVACTYSGSGASAGTKIYVNGVKVDNANEQSGTYVAMENTGNSMRFSDTEYLKGKLDEVKIYNYERSQTQILEDMNGGRTNSMLIADWKFDEAYGTTANDASGNNNSLLLNSASWSKSGKFGSAWNGTGATWTCRTTGACNADSDFDFAAADDFTISTWFKSDSASNPASAAEYLLEHADSLPSPNGLAGYSLYANTSGNIVFGINDDTDWGASAPSTPTPDDTATSTTDLYDNTWHHVVAVKKGVSRIDLYVDGQLNASDTSISATGTLDSNNFFRVGDDDGDSTNSFNGDLDEIQVFRAALSADQIKVLYNGSAQTALGALGTSSTNMANMSDSDSYCPPGTGSSCTPPILHWKMDENTGSTSTYDSSSNSYTGTLNGSMTSSDWQPGKLGSALRFDGVDDSIQNTSISPPTGDFTYSIWIYPTAFTTSNPFIGLAQATIGGVEFNVDTDTDGDIDVLLDNGAIVINGTNGLITTNRWYHITVTRIGSAVTSYINGKADVTGTDADALSLAPCGIRVGRSQSSTTCSSGGSDKFQGYLDDFRVYNYGRTPEQVAWDYNNGRPMGHFKFDECQGSVLYDSENSANTAAITIGATGTQTAVGTCAVNSTTARYTGREGKINSALNFDGTDDYAIRTGSALPTGDLSVSAWVYRNATGNAHTIVKASEGTGTNELKFAITADDDGTNTNKLRFTVDGTSTYSQTALSLANTWYHVVGVRSGSTVRMYINGKLDPVTGSDGTALNFSSCNLYIGGSPSSGCSASLIEFFDGKIDDLRIYNYALNATQVKNIMNESAIRVGPVTGSPN